MVKSARRIRNRRTNILHLISGLGRGGAEGSLFRLCCESGPVRHIVVSMSDLGFFGDRLRSAGVVTYALGMRRGGISFSAFIYLLVLIKKHRIDLIQTWMYHADLIGAFAGMMSGRSVVWNIRHANLTDSVNGIGTRLVMRICALVSRSLPRAIISCSQSAWDSHREFGYSCDRVMIIPNGYSMPAVKSGDREALRNSWGADSRVCVLGVVGRWHPLKDHKNFLCALSILRKRIPDVMAVLVGPGLDERNEELGRLIAEFGVGRYVKLLGPREDVFSCMSAFDVSVLSSSSEAFPNVLAEAMACGTPCVTTDVGDARLIVGDTGWVTPPRDPKKLSSAMEMAIESRQDSHSWQERKMGCRDRVSRNFSLASMRARYFRAWMSVLVSAKFPVSSGEFRPTDIDKRCKWREAVPE